MPQSAATLTVGLACTTIAITVPPEAEATDTAQEAHDFFAPCRWLPSADRHHRQTPHQR